jgi:hypothetical protein
MKILIGGDSWGMGEWEWKEDVKKYKLNHKGLEQYFIEDGHEVTNVSSAGTSNLHSLHDLIVETDKQNYNYCFWFQSDEIRDLRPYNFFEKNITSYDELIKQSDIQLEIVYRFIAIKCKVPVYMIGGCSKVKTNIIDKSYKNIIPFIPSVTEFLLKNYKHPDVWCSDWINNISKDFKDIDKLLEQKKIQDNLALEPLFIPDGGHPNRYAIKKLYDYICSELSIQSNIFKRAK